jgi:radical SAM protein with 4Fe4S-binding SPASM domain
MARLRRIIFEVTPRCSQRCLYCYNVHKMPGGPDAPQEGYRLARKALDRLFEVAGVERVTMSGGEPFLAERFTELVLYCRMQDKKVIVITNGATATDDDYRNLAQVGVKTYELPLLSAVAAEHDELAGVAGSWERVRRSIDVIRELGGTVVPVVVVTRINLDSVGQTLRLFHQLGLERVMLNRFNVGGEGIGHAGRLSLTGDELRAMFAGANDLAVKLGITITSNVCAPVCVIDPADFPRIGFTYCSPELTRRPLTLDPEGDLRFCNHSPRAMGNIFEQELDQILGGDYAASWKRLQPAFCDGCERWDKCFGGCRAAAEQLGQGLDSVDPILQGPTDARSPGWR